MINVQMELHIGPRATVFPSQVQGRQRVEHARWWFDQMRHAVDRAADPILEAPAPRIGARKNRRIQGRTR